MSNHVTSLLRSKALGVGLTGKAVLLLMGDLASDDGSGIWASKARMSRELETTERTIQRTIDKLKEAGFVSETGVRKHRSGYTFEYQICVDAISKCAASKPDRPDTPSPQDPTECRPDEVSPPTHRHPTPDTPSPQDPTHRHPNPNRTTLEPKEPPLVPPKRKTRLREDSEISDSMRNAAHKRGHSQQEAKAQFEKFKNDALAKGKLFVSWDRAFVTWLDSEYFRPITTKGKPNGSRLDGAAADAAERAGQRWSEGQVDCGPGPDAAVALFPAGHAGRSS